MFGKKRIERKVPERKNQSVFRVGVCALHTLGRHVVNEPKVGCHVVNDSKIAYSIGCHVVDELRIF